MPGNALTGGNIANIERIKIETIETTPATYIFDTATSCSYDAVISNGEEKEQRCGNVLMGLLRTEDLVKGYDLKLEDQRLILEIMALVDGGTLTAATQSAGAKYTAPPAGQPVTRKKFDLTLYTSDRDTAADVIKYNAWKFPKCAGTPISGSFRNGDFSQMNYTLRSRPSIGQPAMSIEEVESLPEPT